MRNSLLRLRRATLRLLFLSPMLTLTNCASPQEPAAITVVQNNTGCKVFRQITWSKADSKESVHQILSHNRAYSTLCKAKP